MISSAHKNSAISKSITATPATLANSVQPLDHSKTLDTTHSSTGKDFNTSFQKLQLNILNTDKMHPSENDSEKGSITSDVESLTKPDPHHTDM